MRTVLLVIALAVLSISASAHTAFTLVSSEKKTIKESDLTGLDGSQTKGSVSGSNLSYAAGDIRIIVLTGPEDDMLSYRIQGLRNPNVVVPAGATLRILFVNVDTDMRHDVRFGHITGDFPIAPDITNAPGSAKLTARSEDNVLQAEELVIKATGTGAFKYFCSVRGHAKGGMWGNIFVGVAPGKDVKTAEKTQHVHSPDEDNDGHDQTKPKPVGSPTLQKPASHSHEQPRSTDSVKPAASPSPSAHGDHGSASVVHEGSSHSSNTHNMKRQGSGTSWIPDRSPVYGYMKMFDDGSMLMLHGTMFLRYTSIGSDRDVSVAGKGGRSRVDAPSMFMAMYSKPIGNKSEVGFRTMFSLDPLIERGYGYPLLYQSGELFRGEPIHDRQHPHEFVSELAGTYSYKFDDKSSFSLYAGLPGEPALGPAMYLHRPSGMNNPDAPIGHHWQDASHITFGVVTAGFTHDKIKVEASAFNGTEPDENRWAFDAPKLNSFSGRFSVNPTREWSFQVSHGYLKYPERSEPDLKVLRRTTASAHYQKFIGDEGDWFAGALVWGRNSSDEGNGNAFLVEGNYEFKKNSIFGRFEQVQKNAHELVLPSPHPEGNLWVGAYSLGYLRDVVRTKTLNVGVGGMATFNTNPASISDFYGGTKHAGWQLFVRLRPSRIM